MNKVNKERIGWEFCPKCGLNLRNPDVKYKHNKGECNGTRSS